MLVMKFGGSSVADRAQIEKVLGIVRGRLARGPIVVSSAHKGITNALIASGEAAARGDERAGSAVVEAQRAILRELGVGEAVLSPLFDELTELLHGIRLVRELSRRSLDYVSSFGERLAVRAIAEFFSASGLPARAYDAWELGFVTDSVFGAARPLPGFEGRVKSAFAELVPAGVVPIVTGFVGKSAVGELTTVGRNGSDLTATLFAAALGAREVEIWSDTDGVMTADPRLVEEAQSIARMSFDEAAELAYFGSRMLHPATLVPATANEIPVRVLNTNRPEHPGTVIERTLGEPDRAVTSVAYKENQSVLTVSSPRMLGERGFLSEIFAVAARNGIVIDLVSTSEISVSFTMPDDAEVQRALPEFEALGACRLATGKAVLSVVGQGMPAHPGAGAWILRAVADSGVNVEMMSYGHGAINLSMVIDGRDVSRAVRSLHRALVEGEG